jgi:DNA-binding NarL/FixJ family response regulator
MSYTVYTQFEDDIIELVANGYKQHEIAEMLTPKVEEHSVNKYLDKIKTKWGAKNTPNLIHLWHLKQKSNA